MFSAGDKGRFLLLKIREVTKGVFARLREGVERKGKGEPCGGVRQNP